MKEHTEQHLDKLSKKVIQSSLETPSLDFTANIMANLDSPIASETIEYKPLISKLGWFGIAVVVAGIAAFVFYGNSEPISWLEGIDLSILIDNKVSESVSAFSISKLMTYVIVMFGLLWFIQVQLIKRQVDKRLSY